MVFGIPGTPDIPFVDDAIKKAEEAARALAAATAIDPAR